MDKDVLKSLYGYCAYQERCILDVKKKLTEIEIPPEAHAIYIKKLQEGNYLNEERFAEAYVNGHIRKKWGREKIRLNLKSKNIDDRHIFKAFKDIDEEKYLIQLERLLSRKKEKYRLKENKNLRHKLFQFARQKGFEVDQINKVLNEID